MESDKYEQDEEQLERQVNEIFEDLSNKSTEQRIAIATFDIMNHIDEERIANQEVWKAWTEHGRSNGKKPGRFLHVFVAGFANAGAYTVPTPVDAPEEVIDDAKAKSLREEVAAKEDRLLLAHTAMQSIRSLMPSVYELTPREIKRAEAKARKLKAPKYL